MKTDDLVVMLATGAGIAPKHVMVGTHAGDMILASAL